jgi:hypothetical protein
MMEKIETEQTKEELPYSDALVTLGDVLDPNIRGEIYMGKRSIDSTTYEEQTIPNCDLSDKGYEYSEIIREQIEREIKENRLTLTMFTCPNGDATDIENRFSEIIPTEFDKNQIFFQRISLLKKLFSLANSQEIPLTLNVVIGDTDFLTYYYPLIESSTKEIDLEEYIKNTVKFRDSITATLKKFFGQGGINADVYSYKDQDITDLKLANLRQPRSTINVISLLLNSTNWGTEEIDSSSIDPRDIQEETFYTSRRCNSSRFDKAIFANREESVYKQMAKIKANEYRKQGDIVKNLGGRIVLMDELPPSLKTRFLTNKKDLLFLFPWIRSNDDWRNQNKEELEYIRDLKKDLLS